MLLLVLQLAGPVCVTAVCAVAMIADSCKACPNCHTMVHRFAGCPHMTCRQVLQHLHLLTTACMSGLLGAVEASSVG